MGQSQNAVDMQFCDSPSISKRNLKWNRKNKLKNRRTKKMSSEEKKEIQVLIETALKKI